MILATYIVQQSTLKSPSFSLHEVNPIPHGDFSFYLSYFGGPMKILGIAHYCWGGTYYINSSGLICKSESKASRFKWVGNTICRCSNFLTFFIIRLDNGQYIFVLNGLRFKRI